MSLVGPPNQGIDLLMKHGILTCDAEQYIMHGSTHASKTGLEKDTVELSSNKQTSPTKYKKLGLGALALYLAGLIASKGQKNPLKWNIKKPLGMFSSVGKSALGALRRGLNKETIFSKLKHSKNKA